MRIRGHWKIILCGALVLASAAPLEAQRRPVPVQPAPRGLQTMLMIGGSQLDIGELNDRLAAFGYPRFDEQFLQLGFNGAVVRDRLLLGFELAGQLRPASTTADNRFRTRVTGGYAMLNLGYDALRQGGFSLQPKVGVGGGGINLQITDRDAPPFDELLAQPGRGVHMTSGSLLVDGSLGIVYRLQPRATARGLRGIMIGARGGYTQSVLRGEWMRQAADAPGGPRAGWGGPHFEFLIGRSLRR